MATPRLPSRRRRRRLHPHRLSRSLALESPVTAATGLCQWEKGLCQCRGSVQRSSICARLTVEKRLSVFQWRTRLLQRRRRRHPILSCEMTSWTSGGMVEQVRPLDLRVGPYTCTQQVICDPTLAKRRRLRRRTTSSCWITRTSTSVALGWSNELGSRSVHHPHHLCRPRRPQPPRELLSCHHCRLLDETRRPCRNCAATTA